MSLGNISAALRDHCIVAIWHTLDKAVGMGMPGSLHYLLKSSIRLAVSNVLTDGSSLQPGLLKHHTKVSSQAVTGQLLYRMSADQDLSLIHIVETHQQVDHSRLTASGRSYNGNAHTWFYMEIKVLNQFL